MPHNKRTFLTLIDVFVSAGAAVVIFAAWAKLTHQSYADMMLTIGMWTETGIFLVYAIIEWVKPKHHEEDDEPGDELIANPSLDSMDKMLQQADITPTNLKKLSEGFQKLQSTVGNMHECSKIYR
jgi:predicted ATP-grasp superfamily ATP-dependent carboligase